METGEQAHRKRAIQHPTFPFIQQVHRVLYPVGSLQYLFIMREMLVNFMGSLTIPYVLSLSCENIGAAIC